MNFPFTSSIIWSRILTAIGTMCLAVLMFTSCKVPSDEPQGKSLGSEPPQLAKSPNETPDAKELYNEGNAWLRLGNLDEAVRAYTAALTADPSLVRAYVNRGATWIQLGEYDKAIADYTKAIDIDPANALAYINRGNAYSETGNFERAVADYRRALEINPRASDARQHLADAQSQLTGGAELPTVAARRLAELSADELDAVSKICERVLLEYFPARPALMYRQTLYYLPTSDEGPLEIKLETPVQLPAITISQDSTRYSTIRRELKEKISYIGLEVGGKEYRVAESLVLISPAGGSIMEPLDAITIVPTAVQVQ